MSWRRGLVSTLAAVSVALTATVVEPVSAHAQEEEQSQCRNYVALVVPGTTETERGSTSKIGMLRSVTDAMAKQAGDQFLVQSVDYPASVGGLIAPIYGANTPFSDSVKEGIDLTINYALEYKKRCPGVKFALMGYSQGALVAGDVTEIVGNGKAEGLSADDFIGSLLYADPRRARSQINGQQVQREGSEKTVKGITDIAMEGEGIFGYRKEFGEMTSKTVSFCTTTDIVCNLSLEARDAADWLASIAEYNTGSNLDQLRAFQDIGYGSISREVAMATPDMDASSPLMNPDEIISNRIANPASLISMLSGFLILTPQIVGNKPVNAIATAFGAEPIAPEGEDANEILREGLNMKSLVPFLETLTVSSITLGHAAYPYLPVSADGTTSTQWGANWLVARMN